MRRRDTRRSTAGLRGGRCMMSASFGSSAGGGKGAGGYIGQAEWTNNRGPCLFGSRWAPPAGHRAEGSSQAREMAGNMSQPRSMVRIRMVEMASGKLMAT